MSQAGSVRVVSEKEKRKALFASFIGSAIEWYDFFIYGTAVALVFNEIFFPSFDPFVGLLLSYVTFSVTFFIRPLGGAVFGHIGDKVGRKTSLVLTLVLMGGATFLIGILPDYNTIGILAPILLLLFRCVQGIGIGGEWSGAMLLAVEYSEDKKRGFFGSIPQLGVPVGLVLGTITFSLLTMLPEASFLAWGWRIPFILSAVLVLIALWIRSTLDETPIFQEAREQGTIKKAPILETLRNHWKMVLVGVALVAGTTCPFYIFSNFSIAYSTNYLGIDRSFILNAITIATIITMFTIPLFGKISDRIGRKTIYLSCLLSILVFAVPYFYFMSLASGTAIVIATIVGFILWSVGWSIQGTMYAEMFSTDVRYTGMTLGYQLGAAIAGGSAPIIALLLLDKYETWVPLSLIIIIATVLSLVALYYFRVSKDMQTEG